MRCDRRAFLVGLLGALAVPALSRAVPRRRPVVRRRRRVRRRRIRRRVLWRTLNGRRLLAVPLALAVGWELALDDRVVIVKEIHEQKIIVEQAGGKTEEIEVVKEDTAENKKELEGSEYEVEEEVEEGK